MALAKKYRLKRKKDFERALKGGKGIREDFLLLKIIKNNLGFNRFGFIIGKNISKKATIRNKLKRRISEIVRLKLKELKSGFDGIFIAFPGIEKKDFQEIKSLIEKIFFKAKLLK